MNNLLHEKEKGFTLVEMIVYIAISSMIFFTLVTFIFTVSSQQNRIESGIYLDSESRHIFTQLEYIIQNSQEITDPDPGEMNQTLTLIVDDGSKSPTDIYIDEGKMMLDEDGDQKYLTGDNLLIENFEIENFTTDGAPTTIQIRFSLTATVDTAEQHGVSQKDFTSSFTLREYD